jgi:hypothetical protein
MRKIFLSVNYRKQKSMIEVLNSEQARQASENRKKLYSIVETIILCGKFEMSLRGKNDSGRINVDEEENFTAYQNIFAQHKWRRSINWVSSSFNSKIH